MGLKVSLVKVAAIIIMLGVYQPVFNVITLILFMISLSFTDRIVDKLIPYEGMNEV